MLWDGPQGDASVALEYWEKYVNDLKTVTIYNDADRALAQALVCNRMAALHRDQVAELSDGRGPFGLSVSFATHQKNNATAINRAKKMVVACLEQSLALAPGSPADVPVAGRGLSGLGRFRPTRSGRAPAAGEVSRRPRNPHAPGRAIHREKRTGGGLAVGPESTRRSSRSTNHCAISNGSSGSAWLASSALAKNWDEGRNEFATAEQLLPDCRNEYTYLARRVVFEAKAGQDEQSEQYLDQAQALPERPDATLARALDRVDSLRHDQGDPEGLCPALGVGAQEQMPERDRRRDGLAHECVPGRPS